MIRSEAIRIVSLLQGAYPRQEMPDSTPEIYAMALGDLEYDEVLAAVTRLVQSSRWLPTIAEIRELVAEARVKLPEPELAWGEVRRGIREHGLQSMPAWSCAEIREAVEIIGWWSLCTSTNTAASRSAWIAAYGALRRRRLAREISPGADALPGQLRLLPGGGGQR